MIKLGQDTPTNFFIGNEPVLKMYLGENLVWDGNQPNTFIGNASALTPTKASLATRIGIAESSISYFQIVGTTVEAKINVSYTMLFYAFLNTAVTFFKDIDGKCTNFEFGVFQGSSLKFGYFPAVLTMQTASFKSCPQLQTVVVPASSLGTALNNEHFLNSNPANLTVYARPDMATVNAGAPDGDLQYVTSNGGIVNYTNAYLSLLTTPNPITNLSILETFATALQLSFTPLTGSNAIDYYEVWVNGTYNNRITKSGGYAKNLIPNTQYTIEVKPVDIYHNKSSSNILSQTTTATDPYPISNFVSYYKMEDNALDSVGSNHGTPVAITYADGLVGRTAVFNGSTSRFTAANSDDLKLTSGTIGIVVKATNAGSSFRGLILKSNAFGLFLDGGVLITYSWGGTAGTRSTAQNLNNGLNNVVFMTFQSGVTNGTKIYLNKNLVLTTTITVLNQDSPLTIGYNANVQNINAQLDEGIVINAVATSAEISSMTDKLQAGHHLI